MLHEASISINAETRARMPSPRDAGGNLLDFAVARLAESLGLASSSDVGWYHQDYLSSALADVVQGVGGA